MYDRYDYEEKALDVWPFPIRAIGPLLHSPETSTWWPVDAIAWNLAKSRLYAFFICEN